jgi:hypothetical protein
MSTIDFDFQITQYYFDTFIVGQHYSVPHLVADLNLKRQQAIELLARCEEYKSSNLTMLIKMIDTELAKHNLNDHPNIEDCESAYWVIRLGRQSALEISTYGRIRPETMNLLMCLDDDAYMDAMSIAGRLSNKIENLGYSALNTNTPIPPTMPVVE